MRQRKRGQEKRGRKLEAQKILTAEESADVVVSKDIKGRQRKKRIRQNYAYYTFEVHFKIQRSLL